MPEKAHQDPWIHTYDIGSLPPSDVIDRLYAAAASPPPLSESPEVARVFAQLYRYARNREDVVAVGALADGELVGFAYGHPWDWESESDPWSDQLRNLLGEDSARLIQGSFAIMLLAVHPSAGRRGLGTALLDVLMNAAKAKTCWLQTTDLDSPAQRLYRRQGYRRLGYGPTAPDGRPGLVLVHAENGVL